MAFDRITKANLAEFETALAGFSARKGHQAGVNWLFKMNGRAGAHLDVEVNGFAGGEYTRSLARAIVRNEYAHGPLPCACPDDACPGVCWYKATSGTYACDECGELWLEAPHATLADLMEEVEA